MSRKKKESKPRRQQNKYSPLKTPKVWVCKATGNLVQIQKTDGVLDEERANEDITKGTVKFRTIVLTYDAARDIQKDLVLEAEIISAPVFVDTYGPVSEAELKIFLRIKGEEGNDAATKEATRRAHLPYPRTLTKERAQEALKRKAAQEQRMRTPRIRRRPAPGLSPILSPYTLKEVREVIDQIVDHLVEFKLIERELLAAVMSPPSADTAPVTPGTTLDTTPVTLAATVTPQVTPQAPSTVPAHAYPQPQPQQPLQTKLPYTPVPNNGVQTKQAADAFELNEKGGRKG